MDNKEYLNMPEWFKNWENTGLIKFEDKNNDGIINYVNSDKNELNGRYLDTTKDNFINSLSIS